MLVAVVVHVRAGHRWLCAPTGVEGFALLENFGSSRIKVLLQEEARHKRVTEDDLLGALEEEVGSVFSLPRAGQRGLQGSCCLQHTNVYLKWRSWHIVGRLCGWGGDAYLSGTVLQENGGQVS